MLAKLLEKVLGQAGRAGDLGWDADMKLVMPALGGCATRAIAPGARNVVDLATRRTPPRARAQAAGRRASA